MLPDDGGGINAYQLAVGEGKLYLPACLCIMLRLVVGRIDDRTVEDEEVGIGGRQTVLAVIDRVWHGQLDEPIGIALIGGELLELLFQRLQVLILLVFGVVTPYI